MMNHSYDEWESLTEDDQKKYPELARFFKGFEKLAPVTRECLERAYKTKSMRVRQKQIWHCYECGAFGGFLVNKRPRGGRRIRFRSKLLMPGYVINETKGDHHSAGLFCEDCAKTIIPNLKTLCEERNIKFHLRTFNLNLQWIQQKQSRTIR